MSNAAVKHIRVQFVPLSPRFHLRTALMRAPGVGSDSTVAIVLHTERVESGGGGGAIPGTRCKTNERKDMRNNKTRADIKG